MRGRRKEEGGGGRKGMRGRRKEKGKESLYSIFQTAERRHAC